MPAGFYTPSSEIETVVGIQICVFSPDEIERRSVVEITNAGTYEGNEPKIGGLFDPRMGVIENGKECRSCGQTNHKCPGHFGHFRLARPVYYIQFLPFIQNVLSCICIRCSKLLIDKKFRKHFLKRKGEARWRDVLTASKEIGRCGQETEDGCGAKQPTRYVREGIARIVAEWDSVDDVKAEKEKQRQPLEVEFVLRLFRRILDEDVDFMGLSRFWCRPDWMICTVLPIPPPQVRPSVIQDNNQRSEDDLTHKLAEIIKTNNTYLQPRIQANAAKSVIDEWTNVLQYHIATLVDNQIPGVAPSAQRNGRPLKSIQQRLGSKEGRIRYNIQGKRVEFSARSVITPDPNISIAELGVPEKIAMNLTRPERVTEFNLKRLYKFIQNGPNVFPGAKTIRRADGRIISLRHVNTKEVVLNYGDIVNRHLMDGDIVLFNRQPTLHRMSMMAHRVKVLKYKTFRLNVSVTAPYNADFDGDEMNMHCPQSYEAATELEEIAAVPHQILRPRDGTPIIGVVQDTLVGSYRLTRPNVNFNRREFMNLMMWNKRFDGTVPSPKEASRWTGHQVLSQLLPPINMEMMNSSKKKVIIHEGEVKEGQFDKSVFSKASKGIIHMTFNDYGSKQTVDFIDAMQNTIEQSLVYNGFSVGISDLIADSSTKAEMNVKIQEKKSDVETILLNIHQDLFDNNTGKSNQAEFEDKIFGILNKATELAGDAGYNSLANENRMTAMVRAGSKGGPINIAQMIACVGQQNIDGKRIPYGFEDRTLPHFKKYDDGAEARGFIENSFIGGLTPTEFFFHAMSGREGLIDTAVKSVTGDTKIVILEGGQTKCVAIGDWIDAHLAQACHAPVEFFPEEANLELLNLDEPVQIQTCDAAGLVSTAQVTAVTRHDPGETLYEIKTDGGREVIVTASKSLIVYNPLTQTYDEKLTPEVVVGDFLPFIANSSATLVDKDAIVSITTIDVRPGTPGYEKYPKMYDITVPSTLNFAIANGLVVRDTADTGYIQRQLVKAMEDLVVQHDGTVRDANMNITQFHYGEDGINSTKIEAQSLELSKLTDADIRRDFGMEGVDLAPVLAEGVDRGDDGAALQAFTEAVRADQKMVVEGVFRSGNQGSIFAAVNLERLILNIKIKFGLNTAQRTNLTPKRVFEGIEAVLDKTQRFHRMWAALLRFHLSPMKIIVKERFTESAFDTLCEMLVTKNWQAWVQPGEQVGIIAAQSIGEPSTQMSCSRHAFVQISKVGGNHVGAIGDFIDKLINDNAERVMLIGSPANDSVVLDLPEDCYIMGVSNDEKTSWKRISQVSRHPANGGLVKITTKSGRSTTATLSHSFLKRTEKGVEPILGSDLALGMRVPIATKIDQVPHSLITQHEGFTLDKDFGWLCGIYLADGSLNGSTVKITKIHPVVEASIRALASKYSWKITTRDYEGEYGPGKDTNIHSKELRDFLHAEFKVGSYKKTVGPITYSAPKSFQQGLIGGYFDGDGNVNAERHQIRAGSRSQELIRHINRLLSYCGFFSVMSEEASVRIPDKTFYTVSVLKKYAAQFKEVIGFRLEEKTAALDEIIEYMERPATQKHDTKELYDKIPAVGNLIAAVGKALELPGQSRNYGRWAKKESVGRQTLKNYIDVFENAAASASAKGKVDVSEEIAALKSAAYSDVIWDEITALEYLADPKEYVYDFTVPGNDSFMVDDAILVHNTLNSVDWDTRIMIAKNGEIVCPEIGEFVDAHLAANPDAIKTFPNDQLYLDLADGNDWKAISCDEDGKMMWTKLEAVTRHPVVNEDGSNTILEVELESGRVTKATKGKSFLTLVDGKVLDVNGSDLKVGDVLPIANSLAIDGLGYVEKVSLRNILPPTEWLYGTDAQAALAELNGEDRHWFQKNQGTLFTVPYSRSDAFREAFVDGKNTNAENIRAGNVYPARTRPDVSQIPETIPLDESFGFFAGAYLAEGMANTTQVNITNNDPTYLDRVKSLMDSWNVGTHTVSEERYCEKTGIKGTTTSLVIHSTILATVMQNLFGRVSHEKTMPDWVFQAPHPFVQGLVDGYISGDGTIDKKSGSVYATSVSKDLLTRFSTLMARYGIFGTMRKYMPDIGKFDSVRMSYTLRIPVHYSKVFTENFNLSMGYKQDILNYHFGIMEKGANTRRDVTGEVIWDKIKSINEVTPIKGWVYDLTVEKTRNFMTYSCHALKDTFHLAGVASKSNVTRGVPRLKELLKVSQNPKAISLTIPLKKEYSNSKAKAREVAQELELTLLRDMTIKTAIYYDPTDSSTVLKEDRELLAFYKMFEATQQQEQAQEGWSKYILRLEFNRQNMFDKNITMDDILFVLRARFQNEVQLVYSDFNSQKLIMRIRLSKESLEDSKSDLASLDAVSVYKKFQNKLLNSVIIRGLPGIKAVTFRKGSELLTYNKAEGKYETREEYILDTDGTNLLEVMNHPAVDATRVTSTHVHDIYPQLGIEATRHILYTEITTLFEEGQINYRHLGLLVDVMTRAGRLMSVDRYGINKLDIGPLAKASFEETERILLKAAVFGEIDPVTGVSANIMTGQPIRGGTAFSDVLLDEVAVMQMQKGLPQSKPLEGEAPLVEDEDEVPDMCSATRLKMNLTLPTSTVYLDEEPDVEFVEIED
jgi:DNA-directed RNA polymerase beta' subunit